MTGKSSAPVFKVTFETVAQISENQLNPSSSMILSPSILQCKMKLENIVIKGDGLAPI